MRAESPLVVHIDELQKAGSQFYLKDGDYGDVVEDTQTLDISSERQTYDNDYVTVTFDWHKGDNALVHIKAQNNLLWEDSDRNRNWIGEGMALNATYQDLPLRFVDQASGKQILIRSDRDKEEGLAIGAVPLGPEPTLYTSVALAEPRTLYRFNPDTTRRNPGDKSGWREKPY